MVYTTLAFIGLRRRYGQSREGGALAELLDGCEMNQAIALGTCSPDRARVVIAERQAQVAGAIARTKDHFQSAQDQGWALLDVDVKDAPPEITAKPIRLGGV
jgi:hypothetical protein